MEFPKSLNADRWHAHHDAAPRHHRRLHALALVVAVGALAASLGTSLLRDPRALDVQLSEAMNGAGGTLQDWQGQLSNGLEVSLRAVADGRDTPAMDAAQAAEPTFVDATPAPVVDISASEDRQPPLRADLAPRQLQPMR
jgi:hypothetical protein